MGFSGCGGFHRFGPGVGVLRDQVKCPEVNRYNHFRAQQLDGAQRVLWTHSEVVANRDYGQIETLFANQGHISKQTGISSQINGLAVAGIDQETNRISSIRAVWQE